MQPRPHACNCTHRRALHSGHAMASIRLVSAADVNSRLALQLHGAASEARRRAFASVLGPGKRLCGWLRARGRGARRSVEATHARGARGSRGPGREGEARVEDRGFGVGRSAKASPQSLPPLVASSPPHPPLASLSSPSFDLASTTARLTRHLSGHRTHLPLDSPLNFSHRMSDSGTYWDTEESMRRALDADLRLARTGGGLERLVVRCHTKLPAACCLRKPPSTAECNSPC